MSDQINEWMNRAQALLTDPPAIDQEPMSLAQPRLIEAQACLLRALRGIIEEMAHPVRVVQVEEPETELKRLRRVNGEWGQVMSVLIDGLSERGVPTPLGKRYTQAALDEIDRLRSAVRVVADKAWKNDPLWRRADRVYARELYQALGDKYLPDGSAAWGSEEKS